MRDKTIGTSTWLIPLQAEWGYVYQGSIRVSAVDEDGKNQVDDLQVGDIWYFPKGQAHTIQGTILNNVLTSDHTNSARP